MANTPKKSKDPTELALSAIEEALSMRNDPPAAEPTVPPAAIQFWPLRRTR